MRFCQRLCDILAINPTSTLLHVQAGFVKKKGRRQEAEGRREDNQWGLVPGLGKAGQRAESYRV